MSSYVWNGGRDDFPTRAEAENDARWDDFAAALEAESFDEHYGSEVDGNAELPADDIEPIGYYPAFLPPESVGLLRNAPGQLSLFGGRP